jgi:hypothetical protein
MKPALKNNKGFYGVVFVMLALGATSETKKYVDSDLLTRTGRVTNGTVVETSCWNHARVEFSYLVDGKPFAGSGAASSCGFASCEETSVGAPVNVIYSSERPHTSTCGSPKNEKQYALSGLFVLAFNALMFGFYFFQLLRYGEV